MNQVRIKQPVDSAIFRCNCKYRNMEQSVSQQYYLVIDAQYKSLRLYGNQREIKHREQPKIKLQLESAKLVKSYTIPQIQPKTNCIVIHIEAHHHIFHFDDDSIYQNTLEYIQSCVTLHEEDHPLINISKSLPSFFSADANEQNMKLLSEFHKLETFAKNDNAEGLAQYLHNHKDNIHAKHIHKLNLILTAKDYTFTEYFIRYHGITYLCILSIMHLENNDALLLHLLLVFETIINTKMEDINDEDNKETNDDMFVDEINGELIGYNLLKQHTDCIQCITDCFENKNKNIKSKVMRLLTSISITDDDGFEAVLNALYTYGDRHDASSIFDEFVRSMYFEDDLEFRRDALKFINVILNICTDLEIRIESRHFLTELGFDTVMDQLWDIIYAAEVKDDTQNDQMDHNDDDEAVEMDHIQKSKPVLDTKSNPIHSSATSSISLTDRMRMRSIRKCIDLDDVPLDDPLLEDIREQMKLYLKTQQEDNQKMLWNDVNLNQPNDLLQYLFNKAVQQHRLSDFIHTLISMCTIPDDSAIIWAALPEVILRVTGRSTAYIDQLKARMADNKDEKQDEDTLYDEHVHSLFQDVDQLKALLEKTVHETKMKEDKRYEQELDALKHANAQLIKDNLQLKTETIQEKRKKLSPKTAPAPIPTAAPAPIPVAVSLPPIAPLAATLLNAPIAPIPAAAAPIPGGPLINAPLAPLILAAAPPMIPLVGKAVTNKTKRLNIPQPSAGIKMKPLHWKPLKKGWQECIWNELDLNESVIKLQGNNDEEESKKHEDKQVLILNVEDLQKLFSKKKKKKRVRDKLETQKKKKGKEKIVLLDRKRSDNMCIALSRIKMENEVIRDAILAVSEQQLNVDKIQKLIPIVPTNEEQQMLQEFDKDPNDLEMAEKFVYALRFIGNVSERLCHWEFKIQFNGLCQYERNKIDILQKAHDTIYDSSSFKFMLQYILLVGNFMNTGNRKKGGANGFEISALLKLGDTKANDKKTSLLAFIARCCHKQHPKALLFASRFTDDLPPAIRLDLGQIKSNIDGIKKQLKRLQTMIKDDIIEQKEEEDEDAIDDDDDKNEKQQDMFDIVMSEFLHESQATFNKLQHSFDAIVKLLCDLGNYLGEKDDKELAYLQILNEFSEKVKIEIVKIKKKEENEARARRKEERRKQEYRAKKMTQLQKIKHDPHRIKRKQHKDKHEAHASTHNIHNKIDHLSKQNVLQQKKKAEQIKQKSKSQWFCMRCTFANHYLIPNCEMCNAKKPAAKKKSLQKQQTMTEKMLSLVSLDDIQQRRQSRCSDMKKNGNRTKEANQVQTRRRSGYRSTHSNDRKSSVKSPRIKIDDNRKSVSKKKKKRKGVFSLLSLKK